jgi:hypothetical protein
MRPFWKFAAVLTLVTICFANAGAQFALPPAVQDPDAFAARIIDTLAKNQVGEAAKAIAVAIGRPDATDHLSKALSLLEGKKFDFTKKVIDRDYSGGLRQIVHYAFVENVGFLYFRFNFKMTSKGWILGNFFFKDEAQDLFPKDLVSP